MNHQMKNVRGNLIILDVGIARGCNKYSRIGKEVKQSERNVAVLLLGIDFYFVF